MRRGTLAVSATGLLWASRSTASLNKSLTLLMQAVPESR